MSTCDDIQGEDISMKMYIQLGGGYINGDVHIVQVVKGCLNEDAHTVRERMAQ